jgi:dihydropyrimidinase
MFGLYPQKGVIEAGADADIVVFDPNRRHVFGVDTSFMNVDYDIYEGQELHGSPRVTLSRGTVVFDDGRIVTKPGHGRFVRRSTFSPRDI